MFVFLGTIVLYNLLNALAVDDTIQIKSEGELVDLCQRISVLNKYENIILNRSGCHWLKKLISIFPHTIPQGDIEIHINKSNRIFTHNDDELQTLKNNTTLEKVVPTTISKKLESYLSMMDPKIMKKIRCVLEKRIEKKAQEERDNFLTDRITKMESQLRTLTDLLMQQKLS